MSTPPAAPTTYTCKNCPHSPQFLTKDALVTHWDATHTVPMIEEIASITVLGQQINLPQKITAKHVEGPDI